MNFNWFPKHLAQFFKPRRRYLDFASSTPIDRAMHRTFPRLSSVITGANPSALHKEGVQARKLIDEARARIAIVLHAHPDEIIFTSGATESDNLAIVGSIEGCIAKGISLEQIAVITSDLEHAAVIEPLAPYIARGLFTMTIPSENGIVNPKRIVVPEGYRVVIVSIMYVNNEIGTVQPIKEIAKRIRKLRKDYPDVTIIFHTDATQAPLYHNLRVDQLGVDMMTLGATKLYTHKGVGVLYKKRNVNLIPIIRGGGQEFGLRPGTEPIELIHSFAHALEYAQDMSLKETARIKALQDYFESQLKEVLPQVLITAQNQPRTPHITHVAIKPPNRTGGEVKGFDSELLVIELDARGIAVSAKSACKNDPSTSSGRGEDQESPLLESLYGKGSPSAQGFGETRYGAARFSFGRSTTKMELDRAVVALKKVVNKYKK